MTHKLTMESIVNAKRVLEETAIPMRIETCYFPLWVFDNEEYKTKALEAARFYGFSNIAPFPLLLEEKK